MEGHESRMMDLPEVLVETILGMVPFPYIFKARALSKSWLARLSPVSSHVDVGEKTRDEVDKKCLAIRFQRRMAKFWSTKWPTFCPVFLGKGDQHLTAYDWESRRWHRLPSLSFLPKTIKSESSGIQIRGSLLFILQNDLFVANILTQSWTKLPPRSVENIWQWSRPVSMVCHAETYKVIEIYDGNMYLSTALIYDSKKAAWSTKALEIPSNLKLCTKGAHFNGALYWLVRPRMRMPTGLLVFNVKEETFQLLELPALDVPFNTSESLMSSLNCFHLFGCDGNLLLVVMGKQGDGMAGVIVMRIDLGSRSWSEVTRGPSSFFHWSRPASDGDRIFLVGKKPVNSTEVLEYNVQNNEWTSFPLPEELTVDYTLPTFSYQPSLHPL